MESPGCCEASSCRRGGGVSSLLEPTLRCPGALHSGARAGPHPSPAFAGTWFPSPLTKGWSAGKAPERCARPPLASDYRTLAAHHGGHPVTRGRRFGVRSPIDGRGRRLPGAPLRTRVVGGRTRLASGHRVSTAPFSEPGAKKIRPVLPAGISLFCLSQCAVSQRDFSVAVPHAECHRRHSRSKKASLRSPMTPAIGPRRLCAARRKSSSWPGIARRRRA